MIFVNSRRLGERLAGAINDLAGETSSADSSGKPVEIALAHHGSVAHETRRDIEARLKDGTLPAIVATSSLELGIDMGAVDLVIQVEAPPSVASGIQRVGRAGHHVGGVSRGVVFPKFRGDLLACAATVRAMEDGLVERAVVPALPLDVLAQQIVAIVATEPISVDALHALVTRALPYEDLSRDALHGVLDMLSGLYPSDEFAGLRPRISWDRDTGMLTARTGARTVAIASGGTIADRGLFGVYVEREEGKATRVGELDEEMVFETRIGDVFLLGATAWRVEEIYARSGHRLHRRPARKGARRSGAVIDPGGPRKAVGARIGALARAIAERSESEALKLLRETHHLDERAARELTAYVFEQRDATGEVPSDRTVVIERFRDELGDMRVSILSPFGARVHAAWAMAVLARAAERDARSRSMSSRATMASCFASPTSTRRRATISSSFQRATFPISSGAASNRAHSSPAAFARTRRARCCSHGADRANARRSGRSGRRRPSSSRWRRASKPFPSCSRRSASASATSSICRRSSISWAASRPERSASCRSNGQRRHPFARALLFSYVGAFMYEGDAPIAEKRAQALRVDPARLRELLGDATLRDLVDPGGDLVDRSFAPATR